MVEGQEGQGEEEKKQENNIVSPIQANVFSSQLLSQILAVGSLFSTKAMQDNEEDKKRDDSEDDELTPEELRREIFE